MVRNNKQNIQVSDETTNPKSSHPYATRSKCPNIVVDYTALDKIGHIQPELDVKPVVTCNKKSKTNAISRLLKTLSNSYDMMNTEEDEDEEVDEYDEDSSHATDESWTYDYNEDEVEYLKSVSENERLELITAEQIILDLQRQKVPLRFRIVKSDIDDGIKHIILRKLQQAEESNSDDGQKLSAWAESLSIVPFGIYRDLNIKLEDGQKKIHEYLLNVHKTLNKSIYGHQQTKVQILEYLTQYITNPKSRGKCLAIQGPPGNGKTTLVRNGIAKALNRPFTQISLGGMGDVNILNGHDFTYVGSQAGRIVQTLKETGVMNPIIFFDELDKVSTSGKGADIYNFLCHLTDFSQNMAYHDNYFSGIEFDLSKAIFIFSFNDIEAINPILLDRLHVIETKGFTVEDKIRIAKDFLIPQIITDVGMKPNDVIIDDTIIREIITNYCSEEEGVRMLKRTLETIVCRINILQFTLSAGENDENIELPYNIESVEFPINITSKITHSLLKNVHIKDKTFLNMYV